MKRALLALALLPLFTGCAPDPFVATYNFTISGTDTQTAPNSATQTVTGTGTIAITNDKSGDYLLTLGHSDSSACTLKMTRNKQNMLQLDLSSGQTCVLRSGSNAVTAVLSTGTATVTPATQQGASSSLSFVVSYSYSFTFIVNYAGTGTRTYAGQSL